MHASPRVWGHRSLLACTPCHCVGSHVLFTMWPLEGRAGPDLPCYLFLPLGVEGVRSGPRHRVLVLLFPRTAPGTWPWQAPASRLWLDAVEDPVLGSGGTALPSLILTYHMPTPQIRPAPGLRKAGFPTGTGNFRHSLWHPYHHSHHGLRSRACIAPTTSLADQFTLDAAPLCCCSLGPERCSCHVASYWSTHPMLLFQWGKCSFLP